MQELTYTISYKPWNGTYYINHVRGDLHFKVKQKRQWLGSSSLHTWFEMVTCKIDTVGVTRFQRNERIPTRTVLLIRISNTILIFGRILMLFHGKNN